MTHQSESHATIEDGLHSLVDDIKQCAAKQLSCCEKMIREDPAKAMMLAIAAGYCLHRLPLRAIFVTKIRVLAALAPPAMLAIGAAKLAEFLQQQAHESSD